MKKVLLFLCGFFFSAISFGQGSVLGFTIEPQSPSETDHVKVKVGLSFTSGDCPLDSKGHTTSGLMTDAYTHHCVGMLTYICNTVDTFDLGFLQAGNHKFRLVVTSGAAPPPCTPGIVVDDVDSVLFTVQTATGINDYELNERAVLVYPNPFIDEAKIVLNKQIPLNNTELKLMDVFGRVIKTYSNLQTNEIIFSRDNLEQGIYFYQLIHKDSIIEVGKVLMQ